MKNLNVLFTIGLVLLLTCGTALAYGYKTSNVGGSQPSQVNTIEPDPVSVVHVPEPTTLLLLGSGLAVLAIGARKKKK